MNGIIMREPNLYTYAYIQTHKQTQREHPTLCISKYTIYTTHARYMYISLFKIPTQLFHSIHSAFANVWTTEVPLATIIYIYTVYTVWIIAIHQCSDKCQNNTKLGLTFKYLVGQMLLHIFIALQTVVGLVVHICIAL